jgi:hypothetical protein
VLAYPNINFGPKEEVSKLILLATVYFTALANVYHLKLIGFSSGGIPVDFTPTLLMETINLRMFVENSVVFKSLLKSKLPDMELETAIELLQKNKKFLAVYLEGSEIWKIIEHSNQILTYKFMAFKKVEWFNSHCGRGHFGELNEQKVKALINYLREVHDAFVQADK